MNWKYVGWGVMAATVVVAGINGGAHGQEIQVPERLRVDVFRVRLAHDATQVKEQGVLEPLKEGQIIVAPGRFRTGLDGSIQLEGMERFLELRPYGELSLERLAASESGAPIANFTSSGGDSDDAGSPSEVGLFLRKGTLFARVGTSVCLVRTSDLQIAGKNVIFALTVAADGRELLSVLRGRLQVRDPSGVTTEVAAGRSLRAGNSAPPRLGLLAQSSDGADYQHGLTRFGTVASQGAGTSAQSFGGHPNGSSGSFPGNSLGGSGSLVGVDADLPQAAAAPPRVPPFDLQSRRSAALLSAPNPDQFDRPDVSSELPNQNPKIP